MSLFIKSGNTFDVHADDAIDSHKKLPTGVYSVMQSMERGLYLETTPLKKINYKIYGDTEKMVDRILNTYKDRDSNTGVLLSGEKGSGKTLLAKLLTEKALDNEMVVIFVNSPIFGERFNKFISNINQPAIVVFDEFEKVYSQPGHQEGLLTLFDGLYPSKKMFVVTVNETQRMNNYLLNRPGRFFYHLRYTGLSEEQIREYIKDTLKDMTKADAVVKAARAVRNVSYDILKAIVEEINRYGENPNDALRILNVDISPKRVSHEIVEMSYNGERMVPARARTYAYSPAFDRMDFSYYKSQEEFELDRKEGDDRREKYISMEPDEIVSIDGAYVVYDNGNGFKIVVKERGAVDTQSLLLKSLATTPAVAYEAPLIPAVDIAKMMKKVAK